MLNDLSKQIYENNVAKGFYEDGQSILDCLEQYGNEHLVERFKKFQTGQRLALITSEVSETLEADRHNLEFANMADSWKRKMLNEFDDARFKEEFKGIVKDTKQDEVADIIIRCLDFCGANNIDIDFHIAAKMRFNSLRPRKHGKEY